MIFVLRAFLFLLCVTFRVYAVPVFETEVRPILQKNCFECHGKTVSEASFNMEQYDTAEKAKSVSETWKNVFKKVSTGAMPPDEKPKLAPGDKDKLLDWISSLTLSSSPSRVTMRRLNRSEYTNTIRDLLRIEPGRVDEFPSDDVGYGFDTIGDVLSTSPLLLEKYLASAEKFALKAICVPGAVESITPAALLDPKKIPMTEGGKLLSEAGNVFTGHVFPYAGDYVVTIKASGEQAGSDNCLMGVTVDDKVIEKIEVPALFPNSESYTLTVAIKKGYHKLGVSFLNDYYDPNFPDAKKRDRNLAVASITVSYPETLNYASMPESHKKIITRRISSDGDLSEILSSFASRAYRRPATDEETERLVKLALSVKNQSESYERAIVTAISACLVSPKFLYRPEIDESPDSTKRRALNAYELASRLSYFLWSSMPDDALLSKADDGSLLRNDVLQKEVTRMLADKKIKMWIYDFAFQWLTLRQLDDVSPNRKLFPDWTPLLKRDMTMETVSFFQNMIDEDLPITDLISGKYSFVNERLAKVYGLSGIRGETFQKVDLSDTQRFGILTQPSVLTITSHPSRTSPVKRGKWLLEEILGTPPPPPPPDVGALVEDQKSSEPRTVRLRLEAHRKNPACATCHNRIDPLGFAMENFDAIGKFRTEVGGAAIDTSAVLPSGKKLEGPTELSQVLMDDKNNFVRNFAEKMLIFALGRGTTSEDEGVLKKITESVIKNDYRFSSLIQAVVSSEAFRFRGQGNKK
jgi:hypothetical protein